MIIAADIVKKLVYKVYRPDPKMIWAELSVARRKILILIRESGYKMEIDEITNESFMPASLKYN
jgi:aspartokinase/homoserine dehydrogenase 1